MMETDLHLSKPIDEGPKPGLVHWANLLVLVISILSILIAIRPAAALTAKLPEWLDPGGAMILAQIGLILAPALLFVWLTGQPARAAFKLYPLSAGNAAKCLIIGLLCWPLFQALTTLVQLALVLLDGSGPANAGEFTASSGSPWLALIGVALIAPLFEELLFRGVLLGAYERRFGARAIWLVGILFAIFHFDLERLPSALVIGVIAGWLVFRTRSIWSGVLVHFGTNLVSSLLILAASTVPAGLASETQAAAAQAGDLAAQMWIGVLVWGAIGLVLMAPVFLLLRGIGKHHPAPNRVKSCLGLGNLWSYATLLLGAGAYFAAQLFALIQK